MLSVTNLEVKFGSRAILHGLSLEVPAAECLAIIGPNGSGKTVFLKAMLGLVPYSGEIRWDAGARLGYVPQKVAADLHHGPGQQAERVVLAEAGHERGIDLDDVQREPAQVGQ